MKKWVILPDRVCIYITINQVVNVHKKVRFILCYSFYLNVIINLLSIKKFIIKRNPFSKLNISASVDEILLDRRLLCSTEMCVCIVECSYWR